MPDSFSSRVLPSFPTTCLPLLFTVALFGTALAIDCPIGEFELNAGGTCVDCSAGYYNNATAQADCNDECPTGTWSAAAASVCTDCTEGTAQLDFSTANAAASTCDTACAAGYSFDSSSSSCTLCVAGFYSSNVTVALSTSAGCTACSTGYTTSGIREYLRSLNSSRLFYSYDRNVLREEAWIKLRQNMHC